VADGGRPPKANQQRSPPRETVLGKRNQDFMVHSAPVTSSSVPTHIKKAKSDNPSSLVFSIVDSPFTIEETPFVLSVPPSAFCNSAHGRAGSPQSLTVRATSSNNTKASLLYKFCANSASFPAKKKSSSPAWLEKGLQAYFETHLIKGSKILTVLTSDLVTMTQEEAAQMLGISSTRLCRKWTQTMAPRKWPYRMHVKIERELHQLRVNYGAVEKPAFVYKRLEELELLKAKNMEPAFILI